MGRQHDASHTDLYSRCLTINATKLKHVDKKISYSLVCFCMMKFLVFAIILFLKMATNPAKRRRLTIGQALETPIWQETRSTTLLAEFICQQFVGNEDEYAFKIDYILGKKAYFSFSPSLSLVEK